MPRRQWKLRIRHILDAIDKIRVYTAGMSLAWIFHKPLRPIFCIVFRRWTGGTEGFFCVVRAVLEALCRGQATSTSANARTLPSEGRSDRPYDPCGCN